MTHVTHPISRSISSLSDVSLHNVASNVLATSSSTSILIPSGVEITPVTEDGVRHVPSRLEARQYKTPAFRHRLLKVIRETRISSWLCQSIVPENISIHKVSGAMTNAVFFVSCPPWPGVKTLLLRVYGPSSGTLINRSRELHILHILSSQYRIGPRVYGTFDNGRLEEYFDSSALTAEDLRDPEISRWIAIRMAQLHSVDIDAIEENDDEGKGWDIAAKRNVKGWMAPAQEVLDLPGVQDTQRTAINLELFQQQWATYLEKLAKHEDTSFGSRRVFAHNDTQYGNLLRSSHLKEGLPKHQQIVVVDFEYASPNPAAYDIANHFFEWTADYHGAEPHILQLQDKYPTLVERQNFYRAYLEHSNLESRASVEELMKQLDEQVLLWRPASHAIWALWGLVQARDDVEQGVENPEFDYVGYAQCRFDGFRRDLALL